MAGFEFNDIGAGKGYKSWTKGVYFDENARQQVSNIARMPFVFRHPAIMPDVHVGIGATVGSVVATKDAIMPASVGVDIGCGMMAMKTSLRADQLPDNLAHLRSQIERTVPHGRTGNGKAGADKGAHKNVPNSVISRWKGLEDRYEKLVERHPKAKSHNSIAHLGTLGSGNHFIEVCLDESDNVWIMLHSGSRGLGNRIGQYFIEKAKEEMQRYHIGLVDKDLAYLVKDTEIFDDYVYALDLAQDFALENRKSMMERILNVMREVIPTPFSLEKEAVNCHHNYVAMENHFGTNVLVTRKGAVRAREGDLGIIPGSMGARSYIVRGLGNKDSFCSCSHGAGRVMSRSQAKKEITLDEHVKAMSGIEARTDKDVIDESPRAYKNIDAVMAAQSDLVSIVHTIRQVLNVKG